MTLPHRLRYLFRRTIGQRHPSYARSGAAFRGMRETTPASLAASFTPAGANRGTVVLFSVGTFYVPAEAAYLKVLENQGYRPVVLASYDPWMRDAFALFGVRDVRFVEDYFGRIDRAAVRTTVDAWLAGDRTQWKTWQVGEVPCGVFAGASLMRTTREAVVDVGQPEIVAALRRELLRSVGAAAVAEQVFSEVRPAMVLVCDRGYTPAGQFFYHALSQGCPVVTHLGAHKGGHAILKRYHSVASARTHPHSLSAETWRRVQEAPWSEQHWKSVERELVGCYSSGEWFSEVGTQFDKQMYAAPQLRSRLGLRPNRKVAAIFPHMFWDATFCYGEDLFANYKEWFVELLKVAARNTALDWIVKIHPANLVKARRDNYRGTHREIDAVKEAIGALPSHVVVVPPESEISTLSLFPVIDYCLTVRGTVGVEAAAFGVQTLTAGTGRFDRLGFTCDFDRPDEYLAFVAKLHEAGPMAPAAIERARRYAHALLLCRPLPLECLELSYARDANATAEVRFVAQSREAFLASGFAQRTARFFASNEEDDLGGD